MMHSRLRRWNGRAGAYWRALVAALIVVVATGCSGGQSGGSSQAGRTLTIGITTGPVSLDPAKDGGNEFAWLLRPLINEPLIHYTAQGEFEPGLATSWTYVGEGNTTFQLELRNDAKFSDGTPVNATAVKAWLEYFAAAKGPNVGFMSQIASIDTPSETTVRINLASPTPIMPWLLSDQSNWGAVTSSEAVKNPERLGTMPVGAGPYILDADSTVQGDTYTLVPNKNYRDQAAIHYDKVVAKVISTPTSMAQSFATGQLDFAVGDPSTADTIQTDRIVQSPKDGQVLVFDKAGEIEPALADTRVRQAINFAIDRKAIAQAIVGKYGVPTAQMGSSDGHVDGLDDEYPYDPDRAKQLMAEAGYADGFSASMLLQAGESSLKLGQSIAQYLNQINIKIAADSPASGAEAAAKLADGGDRYAILLAPQTVTRPMWLNYNLYLKEGGIWNRFTTGTWHDPVIDELFNQGQAGSSAATDWQQAITKRASEEAFFAPILIRNAVFYVSGSVSGVNVGPSRPFPTIMEWSSK